MTGELVGLKGMAARVNYMTLYDLFSSAESTHTHKSTFDCH